MLPTLSGELMVSCRERKSISLGKSISTAELLLMLRKVTLATNNAFTPPGSGLIGSYGGILKYVGLTSDGKNFGLEPSCKKGAEEYIRKS